MLIYLHRAAAIVGLCALSACAVPQQGPLEFRIAVQFTSNDLMRQFNQPSLTRLAAIANGTRDPNGFVLDPYLDGDTGNMTAATKEAGDIAAAEVAKNGFHIVPLSTATVGNAHYVLTGTIRYETYSATNRKLYRVYGSIMDMETGKILASSSSWIANSSIDAAPTSFYRNSPLYLKDAVVRQQVNVAQGDASPSAGPAYVRSLGTTAVTRDGMAALDQGNYDLALRKFQESEKLPDGNTMQNYSGVYQAHVKQNDKKDAAQDFYDLFAAGVKNDSVNVKFIFSVGSTEFLADSDIRAQYDMWLRQIGRYLASSSSCMEVAGHASHTGEAEPNRRLSQRRADRIRDLLTSQSPGIAARLTPVGYGFDRCENCQEVDNEATEFERRVQFEPKQCGLS